MDRPGPGGSGSRGVDVEKILEHHGVKGMKWGVRRDKGHEGQRATNKKIAKLDRKFERKTRQPFHQNDLQIRFNNEAAHRMNGENGHINRINNKPAYKKAADNGEFLRDTPLRRKYMDEIKTSYMNELDRAAKNFGTNASGTQRYAIEEDLGGNWRVTVTDVRHAEKEGFLHVNVIRDGKGLVVKIEIPPNGDMKQSDLEERAEAALAHFGVKGMRWGIRKEHADAVRTIRSQSGAAAKGLKKDVTKKAFAKEAAKSGGLHKVSDAKLKKMLERMEMERKFTRMMNEDKARRAEGLKAVGKILGTVGKIALPVLLTGMAARTAATNPVFRTTATVVGKRALETGMRVIGR